MPAIMINIRIALLFAVAVSLISSTGGCSKKTSDAAAPTETTKTQQAEPAPEKPVENTESAVSDKPLADFQVQLLDLAFETASAIPVKPLIKDRSRAQEAVVDACLKLDQPVRAVRYADKIDNWRRGLCYANTAYYLAQQGYPAEKIQTGLELAEKIAAMDHGQKWRSDRIKAKIARTYLLLGQPEKAGLFSEELKEADKNEIRETELLNEQDTPAEKKSDFDEMVLLLDAGIALQGFDSTISCLKSYVRLFDHYYDDLEKRDLCEEKIKTTWEQQKLPAPERLKLLIKMAESALKHADQIKALAVTNDVQTLLDEGQWSVENYFPFSAQLITLRFRSGDPDKAQSHAKALLAEYQEKENAITDMYRAETIRPLAEAFHAMGNRETALSIYKTAVEAGMVNTSLWPRAEDLSATCCSMAVHAVEPDTELWERIREIRDELGNLR